MGRVWAIHAELIQPRTTRTYAATRAQAATHRSTSAVGVCSARETTRIDRSWSQRRSAHQASSAIAHTVCVRGASRSPCIDD